MEPAVSLKAISALAFLQGIGGVLRALNWIHVGIDLFGQGLLLLPFVGTVAVIRGLFISLIALLYFLFAGAALLQKSWARWVGLIAAILNLVLVVSALAQGVTLREGIMWSVIPIVLFVYLFSRVGRSALGAT